MRMRRITSLFLLLASAIMLISCFMLYIVPHGRIAYWSGWRLWGLSKNQWGDLHTNLGIFILLAGLLHIYYNWQGLVNYLRNRSKRVVLFTNDFSVAMALTVLIGVLTFLQLPPVSWIQDLNQYVKDRGTATYGEPPFGHAELSSLAKFTNRMGLDLTISIERLQEAGYGVAGPGQTLQELAEENKTTPQALYETMINKGK
jgi:membrane protease YdiL (CAAX protease family)